MMMDCKSMFWLHTPKTSSSLCLTLRHVCCPDIFESFVSNNYSMNSVNENSFVAIIRSGCVDLNKKAVQRNSTQNLPLSFLCTYRFNRNHEPFNIKDSQLIDYQSYTNFSFSISSEKRSSALKKYFGVTMIREPLSRLVSAFLDGKHSEGMPKEENVRMNIRHESFNTKYERNDTVRMLRAFDDYIQYPHFIGCQVKMLNGLDCASPHPLVVDMRNTSSIGGASEPRHDYQLAPFNATLLSVAVDRLSRFFFVGVFDQYERSLRVLHSLAGRNTTPHASELTRHRSTPSEHAKLLLRHLRESGFQDPYDQALYRQAVQLLALRETG